MDASDYFKIQNLVYRYCERLDRGDFDGVGELFAKADVHMPGTGQWYRHDAKAFADTYREWVQVYPDGTPRTRHLTTNLIIEPDGDNSARAQSYIMVFQAAPDGPLQPVIGGRYQDRFVKEGGEWRFDQRIIETDMYGDLSSHLKKAFS